MIDVQKNRFKKAKSEYSIYRLNEVQQINHIIIQPR
jgi:hypothetical protein